MIDVGEPDPGGFLKLRKALDPEQAKMLAVEGLGAAIWKAQPDILLLICGFFVPPEMLDHARRTGTRVVIIHTESPYEVDRELALAAHADLNLITDPIHLGRFLEVAPTVYAPHAYRPAIHHPAEPDPKLTADLAFVGTGFGSRRAFFELMLKAGGFENRDIMLAGNWAGVTPGNPLHPFIGTDNPEHCVDNDVTARIYQSSRVGLNLYRREHNPDADAVGYAISPREVEMAACGMFFLRDPRPEGDEAFGSLPTFSGPQEASDLLGWYLDHPAERATAAQSAREAIADRTFRNSAIQLLRMFDRAPVHQ
jgi:spore maturation protein CgeB